ncbi:hypothetical protein RQP46_001024 [Phenoliferia psychrophenolica]
MRRITFSLVVCACLVLVAGTEAGTASAAPTLETDKDADPLDFPLFHAYRAKIEAALPDPSARRSKKAAQRARHEAAAASSSDDHRDPLELPLLNIDDPTAQLFPERVTTEDTLVQRDLIPAAPRRDHHSTSARDPTAHTDSRMQDPSTPHPDSEESTSPIQPLPDVGTGLATDPLLALKDRYNYALFGCAATVHRSSPQTKGATSILVEKKDQYMLTPCSVERKFVELELCDAVRIDTVVLANFEFFSSMFKKFRITASKNYPGRQDEWIDLGTFRARNIRGVQVFHPKATGASAGFFRYLRLDFLSHYGSEFYCPVSLLRVYGLTEILAWREQEKQMQLDEALAAAEDDEDELELEDASAGIADDGFAGVWSDGLDKMTGNSSANVVNATIPTEGEVKRSPFPSLSFRHPFLHNYDHDHDYVHPQQVQPGESIYGTIMKRLSSLEHNQSLSMHYIEAQGVMLRDAFGRVEKRLGEVEQSRSSNDVLIRQALQDLEKHHAEVNRDRAALTSQVNLLTNEVPLSSPFYPMSSH